MRLPLAALLVLACMMLATSTAQIEEGETKPNPLDQLSEDDFATILSKLTKKCQKEFTDHINTPEEVSKRCSSELSRRVDRFIKRKTEGDAKPKAEKKKKKSKKRKAEPYRTYKEDEEAYQDALQTIVIFVATVIALAVGAMCVINRKLKAAGMYYPSDPDEKASCCQ